MDLWDRYWPAHFFFKFITASGLQTTKKRLIHISMTCESSTAPQIPNIHISCICSFHEKTTSRRRICHILIWYMFIGPYTFMQRTNIFIATWWQKSISHPPPLATTNSHKDCHLKKIAFIFWCSFFSVYMFAPPHTKKNPN